MIDTCAYDHIEPIVFATNSELSISLFVFMENVWIRTCASQLIARQKEGNK